MTSLLRRVAVVLAIAVCLPLGGAAFASPGNGIGSPGIGDPYYPDYGNGGYDVAHYAIHVGYTPATDQLTGDTTITAHATQRLARFDLDLMLTASEVTVNGAPARFRQRPHELVVRPRHVLAAGQKMVVRVRYAGVPSTVADGDIRPWIKTADGALAINEPEIAAWWYPADDHPRDKATFDVHVRVADGLEALSNGNLVSSRVRDGQRTWHWRETSPMATYLAFFDVGQFDITRTRSHGIPVITAVASNGGQEGTYAAADLARTPEIVDFESSLWGPYPFKQMGGIAPAADFGFALENQTRPNYSRKFWRNGPNVYVAVHELAHQWYGDSVSVHSWKDIWLNEGFATFTEWMWSQRHGEGSAASLFRATWDQHPADDTFWRQRIGNPGAGEEFDDPVYDRGAMTLQALRTRVGNRTFLRIMRSWAREHRYANGRISQFVALAERVSGKRLDRFFRVWLFTAHRPAPTVANGFPPHFGTSRYPTPISLAKIMDVQRVAQQTERR
ncbi:M1 family metallopeptidase [Nocardioides mangrovicus]|nr:M1 family metallopeptidase [Nocardioides mangrovicus]